MAKEKVLEHAMSLLKMMTKNGKLLRVTTNRISEMASARHSTWTRAKLNTTENGNSTLDTAKENSISLMVPLNMTVNGRIINEQDKVNNLTKMASFSMKADGTMTRCMEMGHSMMQKATNLSVNGTTAN